MSIVESIVKAVNDNIDHPRISTMIDIIKQEKHLVHTFVLPVLIAAIYFSL